MGRICHCTLCKKELNTDTAYCVITGKKTQIKHYYCSLTEYENEESRKTTVKEQEDRVYKLICEIMDTDAIINTILWSEWKLWNKVADNQKIESFLIEKKDYYHKVVSKLSSGEYGRIKYLSAIIKNSIKDFVPRVKVTPQTAQEERPVNTTFYDISTVTPAVQRRALDDLEEDI